MFSSGSGISRHFVSLSGMVVVACLILTSCVFQDVRQQQAQMDAACRITGTVLYDRGQGIPYSACP